MITLIELVKAAAVPFALSANMPPTPTALCLTGTITICPGPGLCIGSDNFVTLGNLFDTLSAANVNNATVAGVLLDPETENPLVGSTFTLPYVSFSNGEYQGQLAATFTTALVEYNPYIVQLTITVGGLTVVMRKAAWAGYAKGNAAGCC